MMPHDAVLTRIGVSPIHGVGVFAIRPIAQGTNIFANDDCEIVWVDAAILESASLTPAERKLYVDFGIRRGARIGCPPRFDLLGVGWYLNHAPTEQAANVVATASYELLAGRDIATGEELLVRYETFSDVAAPV